MIDSYQFPIFTRQSARAKRISAYVKAKGIEVVLPPKTTLEEAKPLLDKHANWLLQKWQEKNNKHLQQQQLCKKWPLELFLAAIDSFIKINITTKNQYYFLDICFSNPDWQTHNAHISLGTNEPSADYFLCCLQLWLKDFAFKVFQPKLNSTAKRMKLTFQKLTINLAKTSWGSCNTKQTIALNAGLLFFEAQYIDYVIIHECAHLKHMNHSKQFWQLVSRYCPNYAMIKQQLKQKASLLPLWLFDASYLTMPQALLPLNKQGRETVA